MDKTLHNKLTEKFHYPQAHTFSYASGEDTFSGLAQEMKLLHDAAKDLLQPRPEAISKLLAMAKAM